MEVTEIVAGKAGWGSCVCVLTPQCKTNFLVTEGRDSDTQFLLLPLHWEQARMLFHSMTRGAWAAYPWVC